MIHLKQYLFNSWTKLKLLHHSWVNSIIANHDTNTILAAKYDNNSAISHLKKKPIEELYRRIHYGKLVRIWMFLMRTCVFCMNSSSLDIVLDNSRLKIL